MMLLLHTALGLLPYLSTLNRRVLKYSWVWAFPAHAFSKQHFQLKGKKIVSACKEYPLCSDVSFKNQDQQWKKRRKKKIHTETVSLTHGEAETGQDHTYTQVPQ